jgi:hypothetical protein
MSAPQKPWHYCWRILPPSDGDYWIRATPGFWPPVKATWSWDDGQFNWVVTDADSQHEHHIYLSPEWVHSWRDI